MTAATRGRRSANSVHGRGAADERERLRRVAAAGAERPAGDGAGELFCPRREQRLHVVERGQSAGRDHRNGDAVGERDGRSEEHTSELQSRLGISYAVFCLTKQKQRRLDTSVLEERVQVTRCGIGPWG